MEQNKGETLASKTIMLMGGGTRSLVSGESLVVRSEPCSSEQNRPNKLCLLEEGCCNLSWSAGLALLKFPTSSVLAEKLRQRNVVF